MRAGPSLAAVSNREESGATRRIPRRHQPLSHLEERRTVTWGRGPVLWGFARAETPLLPATCQRRPRACALVRSRQLPSLGAPEIHRPGGQARAPCDFSAAGSWSRVMFPCPWRAVGSAKIPPHRARLPRLAVGMQLDAQRSPCVRCGGPANASSICASGDAHGSHFRSPMSRPMRSAPPPPNAGGVRKAARLAAVEDRNQD